MVVRRGGRRRDDHKNRWTFPLRQVTRPLPDTSSSGGIDRNAPPQNYRPAPPHNRKDGKKNTHKWRTQGRTGEGNSPQAKTECHAPDSFQEIPLKTRTEPVCSLSRGNPIALGQFFRAGAAGSKCPIEPGRGHHPGQPETHDKVGDGSISLQSLRFAGQIFGPSF